MASVCLAVTTAWSAGGGQGDSTLSVEPFSTRDGALQKHSEGLSALIGIGWRGKGLCLDPAHWGRSLEGKSKEEIIEEFTESLVKGGVPKEIAKRVAMRRARDVASVWELPFERLKMNVGAASAGSGSRAGRRYSRFTGHELDVTFEEYESSYRILAHERQTPGRMIDVVSDQKDAFRLSLLRTDASLAIVIDQTADRCVVRQIRDEKVILLKAESFRALYNEHHAYIDGVLVPVLEELGVSMPAMPLSTRIRAAVLSRLRGEVEEGERAAVEKLIRQLDSQTYAERMGATQKLTVNYGRYAEQIAEIMDEIDAGRGPDLSAEALVRLRKIVDDNMQSDRTARAVKELDLLNDVAYLVELLAVSQGDDRAVVAGRLTELTDQQLGDNVDAWRRWLQRTSDERKES
jgi:hypothetical protein